MILRTTGIRPKQTSWLSATVTFFLIIAATYCNAFGQEKRLEFPPNKPTPIINGPPLRGLDASLYMLASAEYKACCIQAFRWGALVAKEKLDAKKDFTRTAAAIIDLDETVLDNGWFQSQQLRDQVDFDARRWEDWEQNGASKVRLVPGAKKFVDRIVELGIVPVFITNRNNSAREQTKSILNRFGFQITDAQLLCADKTTGSNKTSRREAVLSQYEVLIYVGDNLRDFDERFRYDANGGEEARGKTVDELSEKFGIEWIILPNPSYGEWTKPFTNTSADVNLLYK